MKIELWNTGEKSVIFLSAPWMTEDSLPNIIHAGECLTLFPDPTKNFKTISRWVTNTFPELEVLYRDMPALSNYALKIEKLRLLAIQHLLDW